MNAVQHEIFKFQGIVRDIIPVELMAGGPPEPGIPTPMVWTGGGNVHFDDSSTKRSEGYAQFAPPMPDQAEPIFQLNVLTPETSFWIWVDIEDPLSPKIWVTDGALHFDITPSTGLTGGGAGGWTGTVLNGLPVLNNGVDAPFWWDGNTANPCQTLPDWPANTTAKSIRAFKFHLLAMNITQDSVVIQEKIMWSAAADAGTVPSSWTPLPENEAGDAILAATPGGIIDGEILRDVFIMYKQHSTYTVTYIAGQFVFDFQVLFKTSGIQGLNCVRELRGSHVVFADDDIIVHDGNSFSSIADKKVREVLFRNISPDNHHLCHLAVRVPTDEVWIVAPSVDGLYNDVALVYSFTDQAFGVRELDQVAFVASGIIPDDGTLQSWDVAVTTWAEDPRYWNEASYSLTADGLLMSEPDNFKLQNVGKSNSYDGKEVEAYVERRDWTIGGQDRIWTNTIVRSIYPIITGREGDEIRIRYACSQSPDADLKWTDKTFRIGIDQIKVDNLTHGRYLNLRISSTGGAVWELHRIGVEYVEKAKF